MLSKRAKLQWAEREMQHQTQVDCYLMSLGAEKASMPYDKVMAHVTFFY